MPIRYGDWPTKSAPQVDKLGENRQKPAEACRREIVALKTRRRGRGRSWIRVRHSYLYCSLRVCNKLMPVDDEGHFGAIVDSVEEAIEWYKKTVLEV